MRMFVAAMAALMAIGMVGEKDKGKMKYYTAGFIIGLVVIAILSIVS